jgi:hypothetical protein
LSVSGRLATNVWALPRSAWPISIALHLLVILALSRVSLPVADSERRVEREFLRLELRPRVIVASSPTRREAPPESLEAIVMPAGVERRIDEPTPVPNRAVVEEPVLDDSAVDLPTPDEPSDERIAESAVVEEAAEQGSSSVPAVDFEVLRKEAVARVVEQAERDAAYRTFSLDDLIEEPPPDDTQNVPSVFDVESSGRSKPGVLRPGTQRTAAGRALARLCNELTGGVGVSLFGFGPSLCADPGPRADAFGHLRPQYMESLPVCTEVELADLEASDAEAAQNDPLLASARADDIETVTKCRLVPRAERVDGVRPGRAR